VRLFYTINIIFVMRKNVYEQLDIKTKTRKWVHEFYTRYKSVIIWVIVKILFETIINELS